MHPGERILEASLEICFLQLTIYKFIFFKSLNYIITMGRLHNIEIIPRYRCKNKFHGKQKVVSSTMIPFVTWAIFFKVNELSLSFLGYDSTEKVFFPIC